ncbi:hypothetical protein CDD81_2763 [Ophiocordyceps australis]|uniref:PH domain-containing protein n=1 Tax=Ophiocordyceps australis TaxID=1399860 RepID=A0A2C5YEQ0_9HYPO|nr:hypothetical protein CDD81_2763 [Ophiocordyceps australis]
MSLSTGPHVGHLNSLTPETAHAKVARRESRLGLRSLFGRSRANKDVDAPPRSSHTESDSKVLGYRASVADLGHWPSGHGSDAVLGPNASLVNLDSATATTESTQAESGRTHAASKTPKDGRGSVADWSMPPLFKAYPQSICHITLAAATMSAEAILRINDKKNALLNEATSTTQDGDKDKDKKRHRHTLSTSAESLEWTSKTYVLVTSGYVLQYAGSGSFDRLPEKVLRLGPCSAAFATDAIPGRHWVLNVSSTAEAVGHATHDSRSLLSKLSFRVERRNTCNLLMVFESADDMDMWIDALRTEIEKLGGKKRLSETGQPQETEKQPSQRILVTRDASRLGRDVYSQRGAAVDSDSSARLTSASMSRGHSIDEESMSTSALSQDERQLEKLRESSQRFSLLSSGQRTIFSSNCSSLDVSPTCESFAPQIIQEEPSLTQAEARLRSRPNSPDHISWRQSIQMAHTGMRPLSRGPMMCRGEGVGTPVGSMATPNFSLPNSLSRRYSRTTLLPPDSDAPVSAEVRRHAPLSAWRTSRALSMVTDEAAPQVAAPERPSTGHYKSRQTLPTRMASEPRLRSTFYAPQKSRQEEIGGYYQSCQLSAGRPRSYRVSVGPVPYGRQMHEATPVTTESRDTGYVARQRSSFLGPPGSRSRSVEASRAASRISLNSVLSDEPGRLMAPEARAATPASRPTHRVPSYYASSSQLRAGGADKALVNHRSLPQLAEGPPPAPPPTRALPPLPQKPRVLA